MFQVKTRLREKSRRGPSLSSEVLFFKRFDCVTGGTAKDSRNKGMEIFWSVEHSSKSFIASPDFKTTVTAKVLSS
jgi:hypothetical protein